MSSEDNLRLFIAIDPGAEVRTGISSLYSDKWLTSNNIRCIDPSGIHMTVLFLGSIPQGLLDPLKTVMDKLCKGIRPLRLTISGVGYFGPRGKPRVLWAGANGDTAPLSSLKESLLQDLPGIGIFISGERPFTAHLTFARVKSPVKGADDFCGRHKTDIFGGIEINRLTLYQSTLSSSGASYSILHESGF